MEKKFKVFSMMADTTVFTGTEPQCNEYKQKHETNDNTLYVLEAETES